MADRRGSVDATRFAMVPRADVPRSAFDVVHTHKTTFNAGYLVPVYVDEVLPGDSMRVRMHAFARLSTPIVPVMDNVFMESFFFFVPNRLVWSNWERFMGEQTSPTDTTEFLTPQVSFDVTAAQTDVGTVADYFGITGNGAAAAGVITVSALPFRAYNLIWNDWFRDEDIQVMAPVPVDDGPDDPVTDLYILPWFRCKRHDYFTTCRPWPQKPMNVAALSFGNNTPYIPGGSMTLPQSGAPVTGLGVGVGNTPETGPFSIVNTGGRTVSFPTAYRTDADIYFMDANPSGTGPDVRVLINDIRTASLVQAMMERNARGGTRYAELVRSHFGVISPDARLQRPEYLGGGRAYINVNPIAQTSATGLTGSTTVLGEQAGIGTLQASGHGFSQSFTEHGWIIGMVSIRADLTYQNGVNRMWFRRSPYDFYWPGFQGLGEQAVLVKEIYSTGNGGSGDNLVFGYQERYSEYKYKPSRTSGAFRSTMLNSAVPGSQPLDMWHLAQNFSAQPALNDAFILESAPMERVLQVDVNYGEQFLFDSMFECRMVRPMAMRSIPGMGARL